MILMPRISGKTGDPVLIALGGAIRSAREDRMMSQEKLALVAGIDRSHMGKIERGERNVTVINVKRVADALGLPIAVLFDRAGV